MAQAQSAYKQPRSFKYPSTGDAHTYMLNIPREMYEVIKDKAERHGVSMRNLILTLLDTWAAEDNDETPFMVIELQNELQRVRDLARQIIEGD